MFSKSHPGNLILLAFFAVALVSVMLTELLKKSESPFSNLELYANPIKDLPLATASKIVLKNRRGDFVFEQVGRGWSMTSPRKLTANQEIIKSIIDYLKSFEVKKFYEYDSVNAQNFSFTNPLASITISGDFPESPLQVDLGMINSINDSAYLKLNTSEIIYQASIPRMTLELIDLTQLIDSRIFQFSPMEINKIEIFKSNSSRPRFMAEKKAELWSGPQAENLELGKVDVFFQRLLAIRSSLILDKRSDELDAQLERAFESPLWSIKLNLDTEAVSVEVAQTYRDLPGLSVDKNTIYLVRRSNDANTYIIGREHAELFNTTVSTLKNFPIEKIFY